MKTLFTFILAISFCTAVAQTQTYDLANDKIISETYPFQVVQSAQCYINKIGEYILYNEPDFIDFCNASFGLDSKIPFIDFNTETAVVVFKALTNSTSKLFVDNVVETEHFIKVYVKTTEPQKDVTKKTAGNPYIIVKVKKSNKEIQVIHI